MARNGKEKRPVLGKPLIRGMLMMALPKTNGARTRPRGKNIPA